jgi:predicted dehydrogenase
MNRRSFVATAAGLGRVMGANDRIRAGVIGSGGRGRYVMGQFREAGADVVAVADIYEPNLQAGLKAATAGARGYDDYRRLLEDKSLDAVLVATPDHWHARMTIDAAQAGKDVYVEKPLAHKIDEGFAIIDAVRATKRIVQVGTQRRSAPLFQEAKAIVDSGRLGDVRLVNSWWVNHTTALSDKQFEGKIDWKQFLGSAPEAEQSALRFFNWYYYWDYSGGLLVGQAAHVVDCIQWYMKSMAPLAVTCAGGRPNGYSHHSD